MMLLTFWLITAFFALVLESLQLPDWVDWVTPSWLVLWACFWAFYRPMKNQIMGIAIMSLIADELMQFNLGSHMIAMIPSVFFILFFYNRIKMMSEFQKLLIVFFSTLWFYFALLGLSFQWSSFMSIQTCFSILATVTLWLIYQNVLQVLIGKVSKTSW